MDKKTIILSLLIVFLAGLAIVNYQKRIASTPVASEKTQQDQIKAKEIVDRVRKLIVLDGSVEPTVAAIVNIEKLRATSEFYANAENGDYVIITPKKAIIYSPVKNQIIDIVPIEMKAKTAASSSSAVSSTASKPVKRR
jgi:hypothetical protein